MIKFFQSAFNFKPEQVKKSMKEGDVVILTDKTRALERLWIKVNGEIKCYDREI